MTTITTPATRITEPVWQALNLYRQSQIQNGALVPFFTAVLSYQSLDILGDANGAPVQILNLGTPGWNENLSGSVPINAALGELVTRADGVTKVTVLELLEDLLMARAVPPAPPAS